MVNHKKKILDKIQNTYCRLRPSKNHGVGVFAIRDIPRNTKLFSGVSKYRWHKFNIADFKNVDPEIIKMIDDFAVIEKDGEVYLPSCGLEGLDMSFYLNHSSKPNVRTTDDGVNLAINFATTRKIKKGEELMTSYSDFDYKY